MIDSTSGWFLVSFAAMCVGLGKAGFSGLGLIAVFIMAELFGKASVGVLLPMLIVADVSVYPMFHKCFLCVSVVSVFQQFFTKVS